MKTAKKDSRLGEPAATFRRVLRKSSGFEGQALKRPEIGVVNSWGEINPAAMNLNRVTKAVKAGIWSAGGTPVEFVISSVCRGMEGPENLHLPHRDMVANYIEAVAETNLLDGLVFIPVCDDVVPAHLMAAARLNLPSIVVTGGYMPLNRCNGVAIEPVEIGISYLSGFQAGQLSAQAFDELEERACTGGGACPDMGSANTVAILAEALGMTLPGNAAMPGTDARLLRLAFRAGRQAVQLCHEDICTGDIMTATAFENALRVIMAVGGATDAMIHLQAIAAELDHQITLAKLNQISDNTPLVCAIFPTGPQHIRMSHLDEAGGIPAVMKEIEPLLDTAVMTTTGRSLKENLKAVTAGDGNTIASLENPIEKQGGLIFLEGSLAPRGALIKRSSVSLEMVTHRGPAKVFESDEAALKALNSGVIQPNDTIVIRYAGPKGGPGMLVVYKTAFRLVELGLHTSVALITDGRIGGYVNGNVVGYVSPEAAAGGPLAIVNEGDLIEIDVTKRTIHLDLSDEVILDRKKNWQPPPRKVKRGLGSLYSKQAKSAMEGATLDY